MAENTPPYGAHYRSTKAKLTMPYGAHYKKSMEEIPSKYLHWVAENWDDDAIAIAADKEWQLRESQTAHWEEE